MNCLVKSKTNTTPALPGLRTWYESVRKSLGAPVPLALWSLPVGSHAAAEYEGGVLQYFTVNGQPFNVGGVEGLPGQIADKSDLVIEGVIADDDDKFYAFIASDGEQLYGDSAKECSEWLVSHDFNTIVPFTPTTPGSQPVDQYINAQQRTSTQIGSRILSCSSFTVANTVMKSGLPVAVRHVVMSLDEDPKEELADDVSAEFRGEDTSGEAQHIRPRYGFYLTGTFPESKTEYKDQIEKANHDYVPRWDERAITHVVVPDVEKANSKYTRLAAELGIPVIGLDSLENLLSGEVVDSGEEE